LDFYAKSFLEISLGWLVFQLQRDENEKKRSRRVEDVVEKG